MRSFSQIPACPCGEAAIRGAGSERFDGNRATDQLWRRAASAVMRKPTWLPRRNERVRYSVVGRGITESLVCMKAQQVATGINAEGDSLLCG